MLIKVILGSIKQNDTKYEVGQTLEVEDSHALAIIRAGVAEEVLPEAPKEKSKKKEDKKVEKVEEVKEPEAEVEEAKAEPTLDWTRKELVAYAIEKGIEEPDKLGAKEKILEAIQAKGEESKEKEEEVKTE